MPKCTFMRIRFCLHVLMIFHNFMTVLFGSGSLPAVYPNISSSQFELQLLGLSRQLSIVAGFLSDLIPRSFVEVVFYAWLALRSSRNRNRKRNPIEGEFRRRRMDRQGLICISFSKNRKHKNVQKWKIFLFAVSWRCTLVTSSSCMYLAIVFTAQ